jgi:dTDP-4-amino-4,6-dideoxygalactose transaminase
MSIDKFVLPRLATLQEALRRLQETAKGIVLLVDDSGRLVRTVTDGDVRRLLLDGWTLADSLSAVPARAPVSRTVPCTPAAALEAMKEAKVDQLPLVDAAGRPVELHFRRDLETSILLSTPHMSTYEREFVEEAFRTNWVAPLGPNVDAFEAEFAAYVGSRHAAAVVSGTAAIHLALRLLGVGPGDVVFCSSLTFVASANPILYQGATPVFVDSEPATWNMSPAALERALAAARAAGRLPKAVLVVNLYGQSADMDPLLDLCARYGVPLVEDAAESLGATYKGRHSGTLGRLGAYSFNGNKIITTSGGGMLVADDEDLVRRARHLSTQAREPAAHYEHVEVGYNYRMSNVLAGIGRGQLRVIEERVAARREVYRRYVEGLAGVPGLAWMPEASFGRSTHWLSAATLAHGVDPLAFVKALAEHRIEARRLWKPMHLQPLFAGAEYHPHAAGQDVAADLFARGVCLPSGSNMTAEQQDRIVEAIARILR